MNIGLFCCYYAFLGRQSPSDAQQMFQWSILEQLYICWWPENQKISKISMLMIDILHTGQYKHAISACVFKTTISQHDKATSPTTTTTQSGLTVYCYCCCRCNFQQSWFWCNDLRVNYNQSNQTLMTEHCGRSNVVWWWLALVRILSDHRAS